MSTPDPMDAHLHDALLGQLAKMAFGATLTPDMARRRGICIRCEQPALPKCYSDAGVREYALSGLCESCFDGLFAEDNLNQG